MTAIALILVGFFIAFLFVRSAWRSGRVNRGYTTAQRKETGGPGAEPDLSEFPCDHPRQAPGYVVKVFGTPVRVGEPPVCKDCFEAYLNKYSTYCAVCDLPILPGMHVGQAWSGSKHPLTHLDTGCCKSGGLYCGKWGQGRLITLHELKPNKYPPGTTTVMSHVFKSGDVVVENIED